MGLSNLLGSSSNDRAAKTRGLTSASKTSLASTSSADGVWPEYISEEEHLKPLDPELPDLRDLNECLKALAAVYPDIQLEVFRELLSQFGPESRLALAADALLKNRVEWVKGRWKAPSGDDGASREPGWAPVPSTETFRSPDYIHAVKTLAFHEFRGLSRSTINAVLAESNYSYLESRRTLVDLSSRSWRFTFATLFSRRKVISETEAESHPLVIWKEIAPGNSQPCIKSTGNAQLDRELFQALIVPLKKRDKVNREMNDHSYAVALNNTEAEDAHQTIECACCFMDYAFEELTSCNKDGHMICFRCVQHSLSEAVFGQGWQKSIDKDTGTLKCPAVNSDECQGHIPQHHMYRAMLEDRNGASILRKLDQQLAEHNLLSSSLPLVRCPFCSFAVVDDIYLPKGESRADYNILYSLLFAVLCILSLPLMIPLVLTLFFVTLFLPTSSIIAALPEEWEAAVGRQRRRRRGLRFKCENPECGRSSCLNCQKEWVNIHVCHESALVALRTQVEQAMSMAIKRVCPRCNMSFVKTAGCNKLTCPCGYKMCYVCRKDIGGTGDGPDVGYRHFCEHFRPEGDPKPCMQCKKCNLWESEDTDKVLEKAKEEAERRWQETEKRELSGVEKAFLETGLAVQSDERILGRGRWPTVKEVLDAIVDLIYA